MPLFAVPVLVACATSNDLPVQEKRPLAARLLEIDKVRAGEAFERQIRAQFEPDPKCEARSADIGTILIDLLIYEGAQVSSLSLSKSGIPTTTSEITIEAGPEPLIIRLGNHRPHIWRVKGAIGRIKELHLATHSKDTNGNYLTAVVGVDPNKIRKSYDPCLIDNNEYYFLKQQQKAIGWKTAINGQEIGMISVNQNAGISLPSATRYDYDLTRPRRFFGRANGIEAAWADHLWNYPRGVYEFNSEESQYLNNAHKYKLFPGKLGIIELLKNRSLFRQADGDYTIKRSIKTPIDVRPDNLILRDRTLHQDWFINSNTCIVDLTGDRLSKTPACSWSKPSNANKNHLYSASRP